MEVGIAGAHAVIMASEAPPQTPAPYATQQNFSTYGAETYGVPPQYNDAYPQAGSLAHTYPQAAAHAHDLPDYAQQASAHAYPQAVAPAHTYPQAAAHAHDLPDYAQQASAHAYPQAASHIPIYAGNSAPAQVSAGGSWTGGYGASGAYNSSAAAPSRPVMQSQTEVITPLVALNPYNNRWSIKARISSKTDIKSWKNDKGEGKLFSIDLIDSSHGEIRGTFFKAACDKFYTILKQGSVYIFSGGKVKPVANRAFSNLKNDYEITFDEKSTIREAEDDADISQQKYNFVKISGIANLEASTTVDVIAIVKSATDVSKITSQKQGGKELMKRDLTLVDDSNTEIRLTLWGAQANSQEYNWAEQPVVAFKGVKIGDYNGRTLSLAGSMQVAPRIPEGETLIQWMISNGGKLSDIQTGSLSNGGGSGGGSNKDTFESRKKCMAIKDENLGNGEKPDWVTMKLSLTYVKTDNDPWYLSCASPNCKKKVVEMGTGKFRCEKCSSTTDPIRRYILSTQMCDYSGTEWFSFFDEQARVLFGLTADELYAQRVISQEAYIAATRKPVLKQFIIKAKVKSEEMTNGSGSRVKCSVFSVEPVDYKSESLKMIEAINKYQ